MRCWKLKKILDSSTQQVEVVLVFFTPREGIVTVLVVTADFAGFDNAKVGISVDHYGIIEGTALWMYWAVQSIVILNIAIMLADIVSQLRYFVKDWRANTYSLADLIEPMIDLACAVLVLVYLCLRFPGQMKSASSTSRILGSLEEIPWASQ